MLYVNESSNRWYTFKSQSLYDHPSYKIFFGVSLLMELYGGEITVAALLKTLTEGNVLKTLSIILPLKWRFNFWENSLSIEFAGAGSAYG